MRIYLIPLLLLFCNPCWSQDGMIRIEKATSHYYSDDTTLIEDSMFITFNFYNEKGHLTRSEETDFVNNKQTAFHKALYIFHNGESKLLALYYNDKLIGRQEYDDSGTVVRQWSLINHEKDTVDYVFIPYYENGRLKKTKSVSNLSKDTTVEEYLYHDYKDSTVVTGIIKSPWFFTSITINCYNKAHQLLYTESSLIGPDGRSKTYNFRITNTYDRAGNKLSTSSSAITEKFNSVETFTYKNNKRVSSIKRDNLKGQIIKTFYE